MGAVWLVRPTGRDPETRYDALEAESWLAAFLGAGRLIEAGVGVGFVFAVDLGAAAGCTSAGVAAFAGAATFSSIVSAAT